MADSADFGTFGRFAEAPVDRMPRGAPYANYEHEKIGVEQGHLAPATVEALISGHAAALDDPRQQVVHDLASTLVTPRYVPLGLYRRARDLLTDAGSSMSPCSSDGLPRCR